MVRQVGFWPNPFFADSTYHMCTLLINICRVVSQAIPEKLLIIVQTAFPKLTKGEATSGFCAIQDQPFQFTCDRCPFLNCGHAKSKTCWQPVVVGANTLLSGCKMYTQLCLNPEICDITRSISMWLESSESCLL